jgi:hypothetical protein
MTPEQIEDYWHEVYASAEYAEYVARENQMQLEHHLQEIRETEEIENRFLRWQQAQDELSQLGAIVAQINQSESIFFVTN